jgi:ABC-type tungstate transport system permease subunit
MSDIEESGATFVSLGNGRCNSSSAAKELKYWNCLFDNAASGEYRLAANLLHVYWSPAHN